MGLHNKRDEKKRGGGVNALRQVRVGGRVVFLSPLPGPETTLRGPNKKKLPSCSCLCVGFFGSEAHERQP